MTPITPPLTFDQFSARARARDGRSIAFIGDSITQSDSGNFSAGSGLVGRIMLGSGGRARFVANHGISGTRVATMRANQLPAVLAEKPKFCHILGGTNDIAAGATPALVYADLLYMYVALLSNGITPIAGLLTPRPDTMTRVDQYNAWILWQAEKLGIPVVDYHSVTVDHLTNQYLAALTPNGDGLHPNAAGCQVLANQFIAQALPHFPRSPYQVAQAKTDGVNLLINGTFSTDGNSDGIADNWIESGSVGTVSYALVDVAGVVGKGQQITISAMTTGQSRFLFQEVTTGFSAGDTLRFSGRVSVTGAEASGCKWYVKLRMTGGTTAEIWPIMGFSAAVDVADGWFCADGVVPAGTTKISAQFFYSLGTGVLTPAQFMVKNLTALGVA